MKINPSEHCLIEDLKLNQKQILKIFLLSLGLNSLEDPKGLQIKKCEIPFETIL